MSVFLTRIPSTQVVYGSDNPNVAMDVNVIVFSQLGSDAQVVLQI